MASGDLRYEITTVSDTLIAAYGTGDLHNMTDGEESEFVFNFTQENLTIEQTEGGWDEDWGTNWGDVEEYIVEAGTVEIYDTVTVTDSGILTVNGTLYVTGDNPEQLQEYEQEAGNFVSHTTENNNHKYSLNIPSNATIDDLIVEIKPSQKLQDNDVEGLYGVISDVTDERNNALTNYDYGLSVFKLADLGEYSDVNAAKSDLEV